MWWLDRYPVPRVLWGDENGYLGSAERLLAGDPGWWLEPLWPPLYSQFLAGVLWVGGGSLTVVVLVQIALLMATAVLLGDLTRRLCGSRAAGITVVVLTLGYPPLVAFSHYLWPEVLHLFLFSALLWLMVVRGASRAWCAVAGVVLGLALLSKSLLMPFVPVLLLTMVWGSRPGRAIIRIGLVLGLAAATVAPTVIANAKRTGSPMIANSAAFNIWVGLNDVGRESFRHDVVWPEYQRWTASADTYAERDRILRSRIVEYVRNRGWFTVFRNQVSKQYFRLFHAGCYFTDQLIGGGAQRQSGAGYVGAGSAVSRVVKSTTYGDHFAALHGRAGGSRAGWLQVEPVGSDVGPLSVVQPDALSPAARQDAVSHSDAAGGVCRGRLSRGVDRGGFQAATVTGAHGRDRCGGRAADVVRAGVNSVAAIVRETRTRQRALRCL